MIENMFWILVSTTGWKWYYLSNDQANLAKNMAIYSSLHGSSSDCTAWFCGKYFFAHSNSNRQSFVILIHQKQHDKLFLHRDDKTEKTEDGDILMYSRQGPSFSSTYYDRRFIRVDHEPYEFQTKIISEITTFYEKNDKCVCVFSGPPKSCKSYTALLINKYYSKKGQESKFCDTFDPVEPGDDFLALYSRTGNSKTSPLVVLLEEFDSVLSKLGSIEHHQQSRIMMRTKRDWNMFLDRFDRGLYRHVILIMSTNKTLDELKEFDPSFLRPGRVDLTFTFNK